MTKKRLFSFILALVLGFTTMLTTTDITAFAEGETASVAKVGSTEYTSIDDAIANWTNNSTLTLLDDVTLSAPIVIKSTEYHILDLGTYTMTAASGKNAIEISNNARASASYTLDIKADTTNPGGITAIGKAIVTTTGKSGVKDRPITRIYGGVYNANNVYQHSGSNGSNCPTFCVYDGEFNAGISSNRAIIQIYGGTFHKSLNSISTDSTAYLLVSGGRFKSITNGWGSALNSSKVIFASEKMLTQVYDREIYVDNEGYYVVTEVLPSAENFDAVVNNVSYSSNNYFYYSKLQGGALYYEDATMAFNDSNNANKEITVYEISESDLSITNSYIVNVTEENTFLPSKTIILNNKRAEFKIKYNDASKLTGLNVQSGLPLYEVKTDPELTATTIDDEIKEIRYYLNELSACAKIGSAKYPSLLSAIETAQTGNVITLLDNVTENGFVLNKDITIDLGGFTYNIEGTVGSVGTETNGLQLLKDVNVTIKNGTITSSTAKMLIQNYANLTLENVTLDGTNLTGNLPYTLSNNCGNITIKNSTIIGSANGFAFDVCDFASYTAPIITVQNSTITGKIEMTDTNDGEFAGSIIDGSNTYTELGNYMQINGTILPTYDYNLSLNLSNSEIRANDNITVEVVIDKAYYSLDYTFNYDATKFSCAEDTDNDGAIKVNCLTEGVAGVLATYTLTALNNITSATTTQLSVNGKAIQYAIQSLTDIESVVTGDTEQVSILLDCTATSKVDYVSGYTLVLIEGEDVGYMYNGQKMFYVAEYNAFAILVQGEVDLGQIDEILSKTDNCEVIEKTYDVNAEYVTDGVIDLKDATAVFACYSLDFDVNEYLELFLRADVNNDFCVDYADVNAITAKYTK